MLSIARMLTHRQGASQPFRDRAARFGSPKFRFNFVNMAASPLLATNLLRFVLAASAPIINRADRSFFFFHRVALTLSAHHSAVAIIGAITWQLVILGKTLLSVIRRLLTMNTKRLIDNAR
jgi:hypothetical protein